MCSPSWLPLMTVPPEDLIWLNVLTPAEKLLVRSWSEPDRFRLLPFRLGPFTSRLSFLPCPAGFWRSGAEFCGPPPLSFFSSSAASAATSAPAFPPSKMGLAVSVPKHTSHSAALFPCGHAHKAPRRWALTARTGHTGGSSSTSPVAGLSSTSAMGFGRNTLGCRDAAWRRDVVDEVRNY